MRAEAGTRFAAAAVSHSPPLAISSAPTFLAVANGFGPRPKRPSTKWAGVAVGPIQGGRNLVDELGGAVSGAIDLGVMPARRKWRGKVSPPAPSFPADRVGLDQSLVHHRVATFRKPAMFAPLT